MHDEQRRRAGGGYGRDFRARWEDGGHGYDRGYRRGAARGSGGAERPWVGGYHDGYQGGSEGIALDTTRPRYRGGAGYTRDFREPAPDPRYRPRRRARPDGYDRGYPRGAPADIGIRPEGYRPLFSPVGGMHPAMGGEAARNPPRQLRDARWTSEDTRWF